jgi:hypothetical protein
MTLIHFSADFTTLSRHYSGAKGHARRHSQASMDNVSTDPIMLGSDFVSMSGRECIAIGRGQGRMLN